jgi:DNA polymerase elongation subunit (family B)
MNNGILEGVSPTSIIGKTIDPRILEACKILNFSLSANGSIYAREESGFLPDLMETFYQKRKETRKKMSSIKKQTEDDETISYTEKYKLKQSLAKYNTQQMAFKIALNSAYGALGNSHFRFYDIRQAEAVTLSGQLAIRWMENGLNAHLNKLFKTTDKDYIIASDTDSLYINLSTLVDMVFKDQSDTDKIVTYLDKFCEQVLQPFINKKYQDLAEYMNSYQQKMEMKREVIAPKGLWTAKKRYCLNVYDSEGVRYSKPELKIMGIEVQRSSTPKVCREKLKQAIEIILTKDEDALIEHVDKFRNEFQSLSPDIIACPRSVRNLKIYSDENIIYKKGTPIAVKGALLYNYMLEDLGLTDKYQIIGEGDKIKFLYLKKVNPTRINVISFSKNLPSEFDLTHYVDYDIMFEKTFLDPPQHLVDSIGWSFEKQSDLSGLFG